MNKSLPTPANDLTMGLWQLQQRSQANPPDRAVLDHLHKLQMTAEAALQQAADLACRIDVLLAQLQKQTDEIARLNALNTELNERWRADRMLLLDGERAHYEIAIDRTSADKESILT